MKAHNSLRFLVAFVAAGLVIGASPVRAALTAGEMAQLGVEGTPLTPMGAIRAGNADGSIPAWSSKPLSPPPGYKPGDYPDPFANEKPLFTITAKKLHAISG